MVHSEANLAYGTANQTVSKTRQIVLLYEGLIKFVKKAKSCAADKDIEGRYNNLQKACNIVVGLQSGLDFEKGGEISDLMKDFYTSMDFRLIMLNEEEKLESYDNIIEELKIMRDAWKEVDDLQDENLDEADDPTKNIHSEMNNDDTGKDSAAVLISV